VSVAEWLGRLGRAAARHRWRTILIWLLAIVGLAVGAVAFGGKTELLGDANWWLPRWLDRVLPHIRIDEGPIPDSGPS
jgi:uncharacterized membrane protein YdfJ with MMPL/SSD domain